MALGLSYSVACGILLSQGSNLCPLHWQVIFIHCITREIPYYSFLGFANIVTGLGSWFICDHSLWQNPGLRLWFRVLLSVPSVAATVLPEPSALGPLGPVLYVCLFVCMCVCIWLHWVLAARRIFSCDMQHVGSGSLTKGRTWATCIGSSESQPLHPQGRPWGLYFSGFSTFLLCSGRTFAFCVVTVLLLTASRSAMSDPKLQTTSTPLFPNAFWAFLLEINMCCLTPFPTVTIPAL